MRNRTFVRCGFTLVELLVVIGIIALLIGLIMPALQGAKAHARLVQCQSNMRQIGFYLQMYANENAGWMYPPGLGYGRPPNQRWPAFALDAPEGDPPMMLCPTDIDPAANHSYVLNSHIAENKIRLTSTALGGQRSGEVVVLGEKKSTANDYYMDKGETFDSIVELYRHGISVGSNYLFMDWHVGMLTSKRDVIAGIDPWDIVLPTTAPKP
ncbi:MAG TPA: type II secretion system protein [Phycisphaerae bacterium]|nr:type II secretion system protein [Phycisphaerae bacterium]